jgi:hypothetical protein
MLSLGLQMEELEKLAVGNFPNFGANFKMMKKHLMQDSTKKELTERIHKLHPKSDRKWGKMNVNQMLLHNTEGLKISYGDKKVTMKHPGWLMSKVMRYFILNTDAPMPKGKAITFPEINMVELGIDPKDFEEVKKSLIEEVAKYPAKPTLPVHAMFGKFKNEHWARLNYLHLDHHLKQFGV